MFASVTSLEVLMLRGPLLITLALASAPAQSLPSSAFDARVLAAHNAERAALRLPLLAWDPALAASAAVHANYLAATGTFTHSKRRARRGVGENIWQGTRGAFSPEQMVGNWASEKRYFVPGIFPASSRTGNWNHVGHYTQIQRRSVSAAALAAGATTSWSAIIRRPGISTGGGFPSASRPDLRPSPRTDGAGRGGV